MLRRFLPFAAVMLLADEAAAQGTCATPKTTCAGSGGYYASKEDLDRLTAVADPVLRELRTCLDAAGAKTLTPGLVIRWDTDGNPVSVKIDVPGYESLPCVARASGKLSALQNPHETAIRCEYGCTPVAPTPAAPPPAQPPVVFLPPNQQPPQPGVAPAQPQPGGVPVVGKPSNTAEPPVKYVRNWYGWQGLILDGVAATLTIGGIVSDTGGVTSTGLITFVLGFPIVHMAHGEIGRGFGSIGMRVGMPLLGAGIGALAGLIATAHNELEDAGTAAGEGAIIGAFIGGAGCSLIDAAALGFKSEPVDTSAPAKTSGLEIAPVFHAGHDRASLGIGGRF